MATTDIDVNIRTYSSADQTLGTYALQTVPTGPNKDVKTEIEDTMINTIIVSPVHGNSGNLWNDNSRGNGEEGWYQDSMTGFQVNNSGSDDQRQNTDKTVNWDIVGNSNDSLREDISHENKSIMADDKCNPVTNIVFIKTHKTGSTTMASLFERFGYRNNLTFALPKYGHIFHNFNKFSQAYVIPIPKVLAKTYPRFNILTNHAIYNRPELEKTVPNATYVTILRDPVTQLESAFGYFQMYKGLNIYGSNTFEIFMKNVSHYYYNATFKYKNKIRSKNGQLFDLGVNITDNNTEIIRRKIRTLDEEFDLVLITEYFDESLILMKKILCWSFDDILYISAGVRSKSHRYSISEDLQRKIRQWNAGDVLLYNHFNKTLWRKIEEYGPTFQTDLNKFRKLEKEVFDKCVDSSNINSKDKREDKFVINPKNSGKYCQDLLRSDVPYIALLKKTWKNISNRA